MPDRRFFGVGRHASKDRCAQHLLDK